MTLTTRFKILLICTAVLTALLCCADKQAQAALIASDAFSVTSDGSGGTYDSSVSSSRVYGQNPTAGVTGFSNAWSNVSNDTTTGIRIETSSLTHPLALDNATGDWFVGNNISSGQTRTVTRQLDAYGQGGSEYYASSLLRSNAAGSATSIVRMGLGLNTGLFSHTGGRMEWGFQEDEIRLWLNNSPTTLLDGFSLSETYFLAMGVEVDAVGSNERVTATLFDSAGIEVNEVEITSQDISIADLDYLRLNAIFTNSYGGNADTPRFDNFRFGTTLGDVMFVEVTPIPEPASLTLLGLGAVLVLRRKRKNRVA